ALAHHTDVVDLEYGAHLDGVAGGGRGRRFLRLVGHGVLSVVSRRSAAPGRRLPAPPVTRCVGPPHATRGRSPGSRGDAGEVTWIAVCATLDGERTVTDSSTGRGPVLGSARGRGGGRDDPC